ncbi:hypothetical protein PR048_018434 [Dryococelus australis]|uniref:Uncharacterized protein n=1 Tax=Dryococelus australis TaxID=614101 RepID=A0ABQ9HCG4_9NEOP|nr:hypothetical protein PR048_018434 [Dryococelus australis]
MSSTTLNSTLLMMCLFCPLTLPQTCSPGGVTCAVTPKALMCRSVVRYWDVTAAFFKLQGRSSLRSLQRQFEAVLQASGEIEPCRRLRRGERGLPQTKECSLTYAAVHDEDTINGAGKTIFCHQTQNPEKLPPIQNALLHHCKRSIYQASIWACAHMAAIQSPDPCQHGWKKEAVWTNNPTVSTACQDMVMRGCEKKLQTESRICWMVRFGAGKFFISLKSFKLSNEGRQSVLSHAKGPKHIGTCLQPTISIFAKSTRSEQCDVPSLKSCSSHTSNSSSTFNSSSAPVM